MLQLRPTGRSEPVWLLPFILAVVVLFSVLPLARLGLAAVHAFAAQGSTSILFDRATWIATRNTLIVSAGGTVLAGILGGAFALAVTLSDIRGKLALNFAFMLPLMIPPQITALAWISMSGPSSPLLRTLGLAPPLGTPQPLYSLAGIALLLGVQNGPLVFLALRAALSALPLEAIEAARLSGARPWRILRDIVLPLSTPGLIAGLAIAFVSSVGNFGIPVILGIPNSIFVLPTLIYSRLVGFGTSAFGDVAVLSALVGAIAVAGILVQRGAAGRRDYRIIGLAGAPVRFSLGRLRPLAEAALWLIIGIILVAPLLALLASSLVPTYGVALTAETISLSAYREVLFHQSMTGRAFANSLFLAAAAAIMLLLATVPLGYWLRGRASALAVIIEGLVDVPFALPGIVVAVAFILLFAAPIPFVGVSIYGTIWIILLAYLSSFMSVSLKPVASAIAQTDPALDEAARLSGARFAQRMRDIVLPLIAPAAGAAAILVFLIAVHELTVSALLWSAGTQTLGVMVYNLDDAGTINLSAALSVIIVAMVFLLMLALELLAPRLPRGVIPWRG